MSHQSAPAFEATRRQSARSAARAAGILYLISWVSFLVGTVLVAPLRDVGHDLATLHTESGQLLAGLLLEFCNIAACTGFAVVLLPYLRRGGEALAHGYVAMRVLEGAAYLVAGVSAASLITLSDVYVAAGSPGGGAFQAAQSVAVGQSTWALTLHVMPYVTGAVLLYVLLYRTRLVPRYIAVWGLVAVALLAAFNLMDADVAAGGPAVLLVVPIAVNELFLAGWLIVKGFDQRALAPWDAATTDGRAADQPGTESPCSTASQAGSSRRT